MNRSSGILMPLFSLPSPYGIGTLGKEARNFVDFLHDSGQTYWQILPVGPTGYGDSPYQSLSTFAGNPYLIDLDLLKEEGLITQEEIHQLFWGNDPQTVDYGALYENRFPLLRKATARGWERDAGKVAEFEKENAHWLPDYALFMALKNHFGMRSWLEWEDESVRLRKPDALAKYREELQEDIRFFTYIQYLFFEQWKDFRAYAHEKGIGIIGDIPIYVALDSVDVWASPESFLLDDHGIPREVAGVPPDYFTAQGQLWGNPLYDYDAMKQDNYQWWTNRIAGASKIYDVIRIDHFRGFESYWAVPYGEKTAINGHWVKGPGMSLVGELKKQFPHIRFIAEDLGYPSPEVVQLLKDSKFPGMKVLEFAFDSRDSSNYLPHAYTTNCVCYAGTHDNDTLVGWLEKISPEDRQMAVEYLGLNHTEGYVWGLLRGGMSSVANLFVAQMQDFLELDNSARMNTPGAPQGNWLWRMTPGQTTRELAQKINRMTKLYHRANHTQE